MLHNMLDSLKGRKDQQKVEEVKSEPIMNQRRLTNKISYDETYKTEIDKRKRIEFVIKATFGVY